MNSLRNITLEISAKALVARGPREAAPTGPCAVWRNVTGPVFIAW